jgi:hypothetical protein
MACAAKDSSRSSLAAGSALGSPHGHAKHMRRLRRDGGLSKPEAAKVIIVNSRDGTSAYQMFAKMLRFACINSMIAGERSRKSAFPRRVASLSKEPALAPAVSDDGDMIWTISDGSLVHSVRDYPWMSPALQVYLSRSTLGLTDLPSAIRVRLTVRRAIRTGKNEGRVLEDTGIEPDIVYQMSLRDVTEHNQNLFERAGEELTLMLPSTA